MRSAANNYVKMLKVSRGLPIQVYGDRDLITQKLSPNQPRRGAREKSGILNINTPIF